VLPNKALGFVRLGLNNSRPTLLPGLDLIIPGVTLKPDDKEIQCVIKIVHKKRSVRLFHFRKQYKLGRKTLHIELLIHSNFDSFFHRELIVHKTVSGSIHSCCQEKHRT
jgi:hypothetical protein